MPSASAPRTRPEVDPEVLDRARGAYLGLAVGDALGATVEFMTPREIRAAYGVHNYLRGGGWLRLRRGQVTDDTTMSLALGESILACGGLNATAVAQAFDGWMHAKPVDIGNTVRRALLRYRRTGEVEAPRGDYDAGNGACMRCLPAALATLGQADEVVGAAARAQAHVTHNNPLSDAACECVVRMVQCALNGPERIVADLHGLARELIARHPEFEFRRRRPRENPSAYVVETLQAVFQALFDTDDFEACLVDVVNRGGDADTTGAIAGMLAGARYGVDAIPLNWLRTLDEEVREACERQAYALVTLAAG